MVVHDGGDLAGLDARYNLGSHFCTYFCVYCQTSHKGSVCDHGTVYRTRNNISANASLYEAASRQNHNSKPSSLQKSRGVYGIPPDPYPGASRITPPLLHIDLGIMSHVQLKVYTALIQQLPVTPTTNYQQLHQDQLDKYNIFTNRYYKSLEGRQAREYRQKFATIAAVLPQNVAIFIHLNKTVEYL